MKNLEKNLEKNSKTEKKALEEAQKIIKNVSKNNAKPKTSQETTKPINSIIQIQNNETTHKEASKPEESNNTKQNIQEKRVEKNKSLSVKKSKTKKIIIFILLFLLILVALTFSVIFGILTKNSNKIISGITINGVDVSNLTTSQASEKLSSELSKSIIPEITLTRGEYSYTIDTSSLEPSYNLDSAIDQAYNVGRSENNIFANNFEVISVYFKKKNITTSLNYNSDLLNEKINTINNELPDKVINSKYKIENNNLIISNGYSGYRVQNSLLKTNILSAISENISTLEIPVEQFEAESIDIEAIHNEIYKEAVNASYSTNPYTIHKEQDGLDFAITIDEAKKLIAQNQETYTIPLKVVKPQVTVKSLPQEAFPHLLATYSTTYSTANSNRATNVYLSAKAINNYIMMPNEVFSYNNAVGKRTAARGYKEATVYVNGEVANGIGGGICQVSSTLYNSVLLTNLEVTDRSNHAFEPSYVPAGQDATVSWGAPDFKFKNNRNYPIKIVSATGNGRITVSIYGLKTSDDYEVKIKSSKIGSIPFTTKYEDDPSLPAGTEKVIQNGSNGCKSQTYKILYKNGVEISRTLISTDTYKPHNKVVLRGTKVIQTPPVTTPSTTKPVETPQNVTPSVTITNQPVE